MYAPLNQPFFDLTVNPAGFAHTLGDVPIDTTSTDEFGTLIDPNTVAPYFPDPISTLDPTLLQDLPLTPASPSISSLYPESIGTEFLSQGDGTYMNIQTGQILPMTTAQAVTAATTGAATSNLDTVATQGTVTLTDPNTGIVSTVATNNLSVAAQALLATGQLVGAAGKLTAQGQALLNSGNLYNPLPATTGIAASLSSVTSWFTGQTLMAGVPNWAILGGALFGASLLGKSFGGGPTRRRR